MSDGSPLDRRVDVFGRGATGPVETGGALRDGASDPLVGGGVAPSAAGVEVEADEADAGEDAVLATSERARPARSCASTTASPDAVMMKADSAVIRNSARAPFDAGWRARHRGQNPETLRVTKAHAAQRRRSDAAATPSAHAARVRGCPAAAAHTAGRAKGALPYRRAIDDRRPTERAGTLLP